MTGNKYICPRCGYSSIRKTDVSRHFDRKVHICKPKLSNIDLTPTIIDHVPKHHKYEPSMALIGPNTITNDSIIVNPTTVTPVVGSVVAPSNITLSQINQSIVYNQQFNNNQNINIGKLVIQGDYTDNLEFFLNYRGLKVAGIEKTLFKRFSEEEETFKVSSSDYLGLNDVGIYDHVCASIEAKTPEELNIVYKTDSSCILIFHEGKWLRYQEKYGVYRVVELLKSYLFDEYELYLLRRIHTGTCKTKMELTANLETYYKFIIAFAFTPNAEGNTDSYIMNESIPLKEDNEYFIADYGCKLYNDLKKEVKRADKIETYKMVLDVIKSNSKNSIQKINSELMEILRVNKELRIQFTDKLSEWVNRGHGNLEVIQPKIEFESHLLLK